MSFLTHLSCSSCRTRHQAGIEQHRCAACGGPLLVEYDLERLRTTVRREDVAGRAPTMWRYSELLPVSGPAAVVSLGEGFTPLLPAPALGEPLGLSLWIKEDGVNPTGTFKARGASAGVSMARELGVREVALATAGNAGGAWAAYGAAAGLAVHVAMPADAPPANRAECLAYGADVIMVDGLIDDAGAEVARGAAEHGWYDAGGMKEPYRVEGKKTFALEMAEQLGWSLPDAVVYPTGGGVGLIGMWRGFGQLLELGWVKGPAPRLIAVQAAGCAPVVRAFEEGGEPRRWEGARTIAAGLRVPAALGHALTLRAIRATGGAAVAVDDAEMIRAMRDAASASGILPGPEGAVAVAALPRLRDLGVVGNGDRVVVVNTGTAYKYPAAVDAATGGL